MTDEQRLQAITDQLLIVRDNLFRGMSKSIQKLQAKSINEVLELPNFTQSPQRTWVDLTDEQMWNAYTGGSDIINLDYAKSIVALFKEKNT